MSLRRVWILLVKELRQGASNFFFIYSLIIPVVLTLLVTLIFGDVFAATPRLGIYDAAGESSLTQALLDHGSIDTRLYASEAALQEAVERGAVEVGLSLPPGFEEALQGEEEIVFTAYRWGEAGVRSLLLLQSAVGRAVVDELGVDLPVSVAAEQLGRADTSTWGQRLLPLILLMAIMLGGLLIPASSLIEEKQKRTLVALTTTPTSLLDVYAAKMLVGFVISALMGLVILLLNDALGNRPALLLLVVTMGAVMSSALGIIMGSVVQNVDAMLGLLKAVGALLFAPGILALFPQLPGWIARIFPTYYLLNPLLEVSQRGADFGDIAADLAILAAMVGLLLLALTRVIERQQQKLAVAG